jgi:transcriptional regulator with XRE-family HTH domain
MDGQGIKITLGRNIKLLRTRRGITQAVLAEKANISIIFLSSVERGTKYPRPDILARLAKALEVEVFELFKGDLAPSDVRELISRLSAEITDKVSSSLEEIFKQYLG